MCALVWDTVAYQYGPLLWPKVRYRHPVSMPGDITATPQGGGNTPFKEQGNTLSILKTLSLVEHSQLRRLHGKSIRKNVSKNWCRGISGRGEFLKWQEWNSQAYKAPAPEDGSREMQNKGSGDWSSVLQYPWNCCLFLYLVFSLRKARDMELLSPIVESDIRN